MIIATWNINSIKVRLSQVINYLEHHKIDILALQELKVDEANFPYEEFKKIGYNIVANCQKTYNGVAIISRHDIKDVSLDLPDFNDEQKRVISATIDNIRIICVYVVNGESLESSKFSYKMKWLDALKTYIKQELKKYHNLVILGDFNIAHNNIDVYDPTKWENHILFSKKEREHFENILDLGLIDIFRHLNKDIKKFTWWDYRSFAFKGNRGLRIDQILISKNLLHKSKECIIDVEPRKHERPSDHAPILLKLG